MATDPTVRFSSRVENYQRYRPTYPGDVLEVMRKRCGLASQSVVADVGSGTGIFSELLLRNGNFVYVVEPNAEMRTAAEKSLAGYERFVSVDGSAEETRLPGHSVDFVTAAQAFHWFQRDRARAEFARVLRPDGWIVLVWNDRRIDTTPFLRDYEQLLTTFGTDYKEVRHKDLDLLQVRRFIGSDDVSLTVLENRQVFDFDGVRGRLLSSSYAPEPGHPNHGPMLDRLAVIFQRHQANGAISFDYDTQVYCARLPVN